MSSGTSISFVHGSCSVGPNCAMKCRIPAVAAADPVGEERAHARPAQPGAEADRVVDLLDGRDVVGDEPQRLAPQRLEQAVGDERVDLAAQHERPHPDRAVDGGGALERLGRGPLAAAHLDERQQVDGVERVADREPLGVRHVRLQAASGSRPDVELANTASGGAARLAAASSSRLSASRSGALSCTKSTPATASSGLAASVTAPSAGSGASVSRRSARRAFVEHLADEALGVRAPGRRAARRRR